MDDATKSEIEALVAQAVERAVAPLRLEVAELRARLGVQATPESGVSISTMAAPSERGDTAPSERGDAAPNPRGDAAPNERSDFARFIQRGLEQEARAAEAQTEEEDPPAPKRGWNPFKR